MVLNFFFIAGYLTSIKVVNLSPSSIAIAKYVMENCGTTHKEECIFVAWQALM